MILPVALCAALLVPAAAQAACPKLVATVDDRSAVVDYDRSHPEGAPLAGKLRFPGHFYDAAEDIVVKLRGNRYSIDAGSTFKFSCYGTSKADRHLKPSLDLLTGSVDVRTGGRHPGAIVTLEGLFDPRKDKTMSFTVTRKLTSEAELTLEDRMRWFAGLFSQRLGTSIAEARRSGPIVGITPYVGPNPGSCRYVHGSRLKSTGHDSKGFMKGTAFYTP